MSQINREDALAKLRSAIDDVSKSEKRTDYPYFKVSGWYTPCECLEKMYDAIAAMPAQVATDAEREEYAERCERTADAREADGVIADAAFFRRTALLLRARCHT
jgi:hypothetical protein